MRNTLDKQVITPVENENERMRAVPSIAAILPWEKGIPTPAGIPLHPKAEGVDEVACGAWWRT